MMDHIDRSAFLQQVVPIALTVILLTGLIAVLTGLLHILNALPIGEVLSLTIRPADVLIGMTIYLKTSIDFAIFMGRLMGTNPGWRSRIAIEIGSAIGNAVGTILIIIVWVLFKQINFLLALMILLAALVLFELAKSSIEQIADWEGRGGIKQLLYAVMGRFLTLVHTATHPILSRIVPDLSARLTRGTAAISWRQLLRFSSSVPFILGLDDFAGYVPLFTVVDIYGFSIGVFAAHTMLNIALFLSPKRTIDAVRNEYIGFFGALAFILIALYGIVDAVRLLSGMF